MQKLFQQPLEREPLRTQIHLTGSARCGDKERNETAEFLGYVFSCGYLSQEEFEIRKNIALLATTIDELRLLRSDLPVTIASWHELTYKKPERKRKAPAPDIFVGLMIFLLGAADALASSSLRALGWSAVLMLAGLILIGQAQAEKMRKRRDKRGKAC